MPVIAAVNYDPATAVTYSGAALKALGAMDTTNLRLVFTVPASGRVLVVMQGTLHGEATFPQILLGAMQDTTVIFRKRVMMGGGNLAATTLMAIESSCVVTGLTPNASLTWDAAWGVETIVASTGIKCGGPNNATANDAFGGFSFEIWDA